MRYFLTLIALLAIVSLVACGSTLPKVKSFKMDIQQGNVVTSKMLLKLRPGMTKKQARYIMGTPLIEDSFHTDRWDYFYQLRKEGKIISQRRVILDFEQDLLARVRGDVVPEGTPGADTGEVMLSETEVQPEEKSTLDKLKFWKKDEVAKGDAESETEGLAAEVLEPMAVPAALSEVAAPPADGVDEMIEASKNESEANATTEAPASLLVVPIPLEPSVAGSLPEVATADVAIREAAVSDATVDTPSIDTASPEIAEAAMTKPEPVAVAPVSLAPIVQGQMPNANQEDKMIFRLDRSLNIDNLAQEAASAAPVTEDAVKAQALVNDAPLLNEKEPINEEEPDYFERILEKIGF